VELRHLRYIVACARNGSFSAAAHELNVRQPIVSRRVREVEDELGILLFDRSTAGARLTQIGEEFVIGARRIIEDFERLNERSKASGTGEHGRIVVGFYHSLSSSRFRIALDDFRRRYFDIDVELIELPFVELKASVLTGIIDVAIVLGDVCACEVLASMALWSERILVALPRDHHLADRPIIYWPELKGERFLLSHSDPGPDMRNILLRHLAAPSDHPDLVTRRLSRESILSEVAAGQGIALECESAGGLTSFSIVFRPVHDGSGATRLGYIACWRPEDTNPVLKPFLEALRRRG